MNGKLLLALVFPLVPGRDVVAQSEAGSVLGPGTPLHHRHELWHPQSQGNQGVIFSRAVTAAAALHEDLENWL